VLSLTFSEDLVKPSKDKESMYHSRPEIEVRTVKPLSPKSVRNQMPRKIPNFILQNIEKQIVSSESTAEEVSFEWSHHRISFMDSKLKPALEFSVIDSGI